jgi:hypothetical protein
VLEERGYRPQNIAGTQYLFTDPDPASKGLEVAYLSRLVLELFWLNGRRPTRGR